MLGAGTIDQCGLAASIGGQYAQVAGGRILIAGFIIDDIAPVG